MSEPLRAPHTVTLSYRRSVGGAIERFLAGLARCEIWGSRAADGRVVVPPRDHDPETGEAVDDLVRVSDAGVVRSWTWVATPLPEHPLDRPFAFALVRLDGADAALLHVIDVDDEAEMATGMRVQADWRADRIGSVLDIRAFVPEAVDGARSHRVSSPAGRPQRREPELKREPELEVVSDVRLDYVYEPGLTLSGFLRALAEHRIEGGRCGTCARVYVPPRPRCPTCARGPMAAVALDGVGTIVSYTIVHLPPPGMEAEVPFAWAWIRLDGADVPFAHLVGDVAPHDVRVGQRVEAVWEPDDRLAPTWESIRHFRPCDG